MCDEKKKKGERYRKEEVEKYKIQNKSKRKIKKNGGRKVMRKKLRCYPRSRVFGASLGLVQTIKKGEKINGEATENEGRLPTTRAGEETKRGKICDKKSETRAVGRASRTELSK